MSYYYSFSSGKQRLRYRGGNLPQAYTEVAEDNITAPHISDSDDTIRTVAFSGTTGTIEAVAAQSDNSIIQVVDYTLLVDTDSTVQFLSGSDPISGPMSWPASGGASYVPSDPSMVTESGHALNISSTAGNIGGHISYRLV